MFEAPPPPMDAPRTNQPDTLAEIPDTGRPETTATPDTRVFIDQGGMYEAPPPPMDAPRITPADAQPDSPDAGTARDTGSRSGDEAGASETRPADTRDATTVPDTRLFIDQGGMIEAPPPPMDTRPPTKG